MGFFPRTGDTTTALLYRMAGLPLTAARAFALIAGDLSVKARFTKQTRRPEPMRIIGKQQKLQTSTHQTELNKIKHK